MSNNESYTLNDIVYIATYKSLKLSDSKTTNYRIIALQNSFASTVNNILQYVSLDTNVNDINDVYNANKQLILYYSPSE